MDTAISANTANRQGRVIPPLYLGARVAIHKPPKSKTPQCLELSPMGVVKRPTINPAPRLLAR